MPNYLKDMRYRLWFILLIVSAVGLALMISSTYIDGSGSGRSYSMETTVLWIYFTFLSNLSAFIVALLVITNKININNKHLQRAKTMMSVNLTVTAIIFWSVLSWKLGNDTAFQIVATLAVHAVTPSLALFVYFYEAKNIVAIDRRDPIKTTLLNTLFPIAWLIMAIIFYYVNGANKDSAIYGFLNFKENVYVSIGVIGVIAVMYPGLTYVYTKIYNK